MSSEFDVLIVGSGTSAYYCAEGLLEAGKRVGIVDARPFGGTCALRGCQPKKFLVANAQALASATQLVGRGVSHAPQCDWAALQSLKGEFLDGRPEREFEGWADRGATPIRGRAQLVGETELLVGDSTLSAETIVLATGASPRRSGIPGSELAITSDDFLALPEIPARIVFIGGGYISMEFAHVAARAGAKVTVIQLTDRILPVFDADLVQVLTQASEAVGIEIVLNRRATSIVEREGTKVVVTEEGEEFLADCVVEAIGRVPNLSVLEGDKGKVAHGKGGVEVNAFLQSVSNSRVYAIGDCADTGPMLATIADLEGKAAAKNILQGEVAQIERSQIPSTVFTIPAAASVGHSEDSARAAGVAFEVHSGSTAGWASARRSGEAHGAYKVLLDPTTREVRGAHLLGHHAPELINVFALAMKLGANADVLSEFPWAYPTAVSEVKKMLRGGRTLELRGSSQNPT